MSKDMSKNIYKLFYLIFILLLIYGIFTWYKQKYTESFISQVAIPKKIWSYWDNPNTIPKTVDLCVQSWKKYNPDYEIIFLNKDTYKQYVTIPKNIAEHPRFNDIPQRFADLLRMYLLKEYGGIWCDSSILMGQSLDSWMKSSKSNKELYAFTIEFGNHPGRKPVIENWFLGAPRNSPFIKQWLDEFLRLMDFPSAKDYVDDLVMRGIDNKDWCCPDYLAMHHSAQKLLQLDKYPLSKLELWPSKTGPFKYIYENNWNATNAIRAACNNPSLRIPFIKMRGVERSTLEKDIDGEFSNQKCKWI